jgi:hypothetical protein
VFTTAGLAILTTTPVQTISGTAINSGGTVSSIGGSPITACGVVWGASQNPTIALPTKTNDFAGFNGSDFASSVTGLVPGRKYLRAYATNGAGTAYGNQITIFAGTVVIPVVTTEPIINKVGAIAEGGFLVQYDGGDVAGVSAAGVCWSTSNNPTIANAHTTDIAGYDPIPFFSTLTGLTIGTTYHVRAYATNSAGTGYGSSVTFTATAATIGQVVSGGYLPMGNVYYIDGTGLHGLVGVYFSNAPTDWGCTNSATGATATAVFTGFANTATIVSNITANSCVSGAVQGFAAPTCQIPSSGAPTYLPSKDEMNWLWTNRVASGLDTYLTAGPFWSSSEVNATQAWYFDSTLPTPAWVNTGLKTAQYNDWPIWSF